MTAKKCLIMNLKKSRQNTISNVDRGSKKAHQPLSGRRDVDLLTANNNTFLPILPKLSSTDYQEIQREGAGNFARSQYFFLVFFFIYIFCLYFHTLLRLRMDFIKSVSEKTETQSFDVIQS